MHREQEDVALAALEEQMEAHERNEEREALAERKERMLGTLRETIEYIAPSIHPVAMIEDWMLPDEIFELGLDIEKRGQLNPCYKLTGEAREIFGPGQFGKNRIVACAWFGLECQIEEIDEIPGGSLLEWNNAHNNIRRHMTKDQRIRVYKAYKAKYEEEAALISKYNLKKGPENPRVGWINPLGQNAQDRPVDAKSAKSDVPKRSRTKAAKRAGISENMARRSDALEAKCSQAGRMDIYERTLLSEKDPRYLTITAAGRLLKEAKPAGKKAAKKPEKKDMLDFYIDDAADLFGLLAKMKKPRAGKTTSPPALRKLIDEFFEMRDKIMSWKSAGKAGCKKCGGSGMIKSGTADKPGIEIACTVCGGTGRAGKI